MVKKNPSTENFSVEGYFKAIFAGYEAKVPPILVHLRAIFGLRWVIWWA